MFQNDATEFIIDPTPPNLLSHEEPIYDELFQLDNLIAPTPLPEIVELGRKIDSLTIEVNTLNLRLELERTKRQHLQTTMRQLRRDKTSLNSDVQTIRSELLQLRDQQTTINYQLDNQNARTNALSFRSMSRIDQILAALVPNSFLSTETRTELMILLKELANTVQHFGMIYVIPPE